MAQSQHEYPTIIGILERLWRQCCAGCDRREATPEERARLAGMRTCYDGNGEHGGIAQTVRRRGDSLHIEHEQWNRAIAWPGFGESGPTLCLLFDGNAGDARKRIEDAISRLPVGEFTAWLDGNGVQWREQQPAAAIPVTRQAGEQDDTSLALRVRALITSRPERFRQAGRELDSAYSAETFLERDLTFHREQASYPKQDYPTLETWKPVSKRVGRIVADLLGARKGDHRIPSQDWAAKVLLVHWVLTDPECGGGPVLTAMQHWNAGTVPADLMQFPHAEHTARDDWRECVRAALAVMEPASIAVPDELVTLRQAAAICGTSKRTLERYVQDGRLPEPDYRGGDGKASKWNWARLRPALEDHVRPDLPERFPTAQFI